MTSILAIDPGTTQSAFVRYDPSGVIIDKNKLSNGALLEHVGNLAREPSVTCVIEMVASYGMAVGAEVFETVFWIGRYAERWEWLARRPAQRMFRRSVKQHLCGDSRAKDANIRQALIDRFGGKDRAVGKKNNPGPLYGVSGDVWAALAVAVTFASMPAAL